MLAPWKESCDKPRQYIKKQRPHFADMVCIVKGMVFPIVVYICESWTFIFGGSKITADGDCSHEIKTLDPWKKSYDQPRQHIKKQKHYFLTKVHLVKAMVFPVVIYGYESWSIKKAECQRIDILDCGVGEHS